MPDQVPHPGSTPVAVQQYLTLLSDRLSDAIMLMDESFRILYANPMALQISQITSANFNRETLWELYPGVLESPLGQAYLEAVATREERHVHDFYYDPLKTTFDLHIFPMDHGVGVHYRDVTALRRAERSRDAATDHLKHVLAATTDSVISLDREFRIIYMNQRACEVLGPSEDILGHVLFERFPLTVYENSPYVATYTRAMLDRVEGSFEAFYPEPYNIWFHVMARPSEEGIIIFFRDITEQKTREDELRASEERYRVLTELNPQSLWTADAEGRVLYANQRFLEYIGKDFVPHDGSEYIRCFDELDRDRVLQVWSNAIATGEDYDIEARLLRASDGASRWWHLRALPIRDEAGVVRQWLGVATDIHESRIGSLRLREQYIEIDRQRREAEVIYRLSPIGMALYDARDLRVLRINERQAEIFGLPAPEAIGKTYDELTRGVTAGRLFINRALAGERILNQNLEGILANRPGEYRHWNVNYSPVFSEDGSIRAIATATIEVTQQKRAELALIQAEKLAAVGRMASSIAHEINNPLESVTNLLYITRSHATDPEMKAMLDLADTELRRVSIIANQTLRFHKQASNPREITSDELFATVLGLYEGRLRNSTIWVEKSKRTERPVACFEGDIRQVLNNLVANAIDAMPTGGRLLLRSREATDWRTGRKGLILTVADTGFGMDPATQARIFEAFFTTKGINGTGLGLWISTGIMERHQGYLRMRSRRVNSDNPSNTHHGTVFNLFLPFEAVPSPTPNPLA
ncbi:MAG: PAS domain-containing protein [Acidobacteriota bacterium]